MIAHQETAPVLDIPESLVTYTTRSSIIFTTDNIKIPLMVFTKRPGQYGQSLDFPVQTHGGKDSSVTIATFAAEQFVQGIYTSPCILLGTVQRVEEDKNQQIIDSRSDYYAFTSHTNTEKISFPKGYGLLSETYIAQLNEHLFVQPEVKRAALAHFKLHRQLVDNPYAYKKHKSFDELIPITPYEDLSQRHILYLDHNLWRG